MGDSWVPKKLVWVGDDRGLPAIGSNVLCGSMVPVSDEDIKDNAAIPPCFQFDQLKVVAASCGERWIWKGAAHKEVHQSIVTFSEIARLTDCEAECWTWEELITTLLKADVATNSAITDKTLFYFCWTSEPDIRMVYVVYCLLEELNNHDTLPTRVRCFPNLDDLHASERKIGDIEALDRIAEVAPFQHFQFRPKTCTKLSNCTLEEPFVLKRTHSSTSNHVDLEPSKTAWTRLPCRASLARFYKIALKNLKAMCAASGIDGSRVVKSRAKAEYMKLLHEQETSTSVVSVMPSAQPRWFHQQKIPSLVEFGEFRLLIATIPAADGLRGRKGHIFEAFLTKPRPEDVTNPIISNVSRVSDELLNKEFCGTRTVGDLEEFALYIFEQLRKCPQLQGSAVDQASNLEKPTTQNFVGKENISSDDQSSGNAKRSLSPVDDTTYPPRKVRRCYKGNSNITLIPKLPEPGPAMFESLELGVRLDIGVSSPADGHRFFVNEITRAWYGDLISFKSGDPKTRLCGALARAGKDYFFGNGEE